MNLWKLMSLVRIAVWRGGRCMGLPMSFSRIGMWLLVHGRWGGRSLCRRGAACFRLGMRRGEALCASNLGACYAKGEGAVKDAETAVRYYRRAAVLGCAAGIHNLGYCLLVGEGVATDEAEGYRLFARAACMGLPVSAYRQGLCLVHGDGVKQDFNAAFRCFRRAAWRGVPDARYDLAVCYARGEGTRVHPFLALAWLLWAAWSGSEAAIAVYEEDRVNEFMDQSLVEAQGEEAHD